MCAHISIIYKSYYTLSIQTHVYIHYTSHIYRTPPPCFNLEVGRVELDSVGPGEVTYVIHIRVKMLEKHLYIYIR